MSFRFNPCRPCCTQVCCYPPYMPNTLCATLFSSCAALSGVVLPLDWNGSQYLSKTVNDVDGQEILLSFGCVASGSPAWGVTMWCGSGGGPPVFTSPYLPQPGCPFGSWDSGTQYFGGGNPQTACGCPNASGTVRVVVAACPAGGVTACCPLPVPSSVYLTVTNSTHPANIPDGTWLLTWSGGGYFGSTGKPNGVVSWSLACALASPPSGYQWFLEPNCWFAGGVSIPGSSYVCSPFLVSGHWDDTTNNPPPCYFGTGFDWTVTE